MAAATLTACGEKKAAEAPAAEAPAMEAAPAADAAAPAADAMAPAADANAAATPDPGKPDDKGNDTSRGMANQAMAPAAADAAK